MEYILVNDWYVYWFATTAMVIWTSVSLLVVAATVFISTIVYDIYRQVALKWSGKK